MVIKILLKSLYEADFQIDPIKWSFLYNGTGIVFFFPALSHMTGQEERIKEREDIKPGLNLFTSLFFKIFFLNDVQKCSENSTTLNFP